MVHVDMGILHPVMFSHMVPGSFHAYPDKGEVRSLRGSNQLCRD
ncbi:hypothetical protein V202x_27600 [Gimesia aquarii]|uniref:Uncharacterized protein n=1 Tax=Gimesia aquarii TaxID=2527964 RepID=A0A517WVT5_9PLAN|nr:hypothetical protein V202x_27600 [Gimesia aquarii]